MGLFGTRDRWPVVTAGPSSMVLSNDRRGWFAEEFEVVTQRADLVAATRKFQSGNAAVRSVVSVNRRREDALTAFRGVQEMLRNVASANSASYSFDWPQPDESHARRGVVNGDAHFSLLARYGNVVVWLSGIGIAKTGTRETHDLSRLADLHRWQLEDLANGLALGIQRRLDFGSMGDEECSARLSSPERFHAAVSEADRVRMQLHADLTLRRVQVGDVGPRAEEYGAAETLAARLRDLYLRRRAIHYLIAEASSDELKTMKQMGLSFEQRKDLLSEALVRYWEESGLDKFPSLGAAIDMVDEKLWPALLDTALTTIGVRRGRLHSADCASHGRAEMPGIDLSELHREVRELRDAHPFIQPDNLFVLWFLKAFVARDEKDAEEALLGGPKDKGVDAIYTDSDAKTVHVIQGKYHRGRPPAKLSDVTALADLGRALLLDNSTQLDAAVSSASPAVAERLKQIRRKVQREGYRLHVNFITTGTVSKAAADDAAARLWEWRDQADYSASGAPELARLLQDYLQGAAPPIPTIHLEVRPGEVFARGRQSGGMTAAVASVDATSLARMYDTYGVRVFARNIRGFLGMGDKSINREIAKTLQSEPEKFWYLNNGVTIVCDESRSTTKGGRTILSIKNGQVINGQQTTRVISETKDGSGAAVLVKVIEIKRETKEEQRRYEAFINQIVKAANWQNPISIADLRTNDDEQVRIERELRKLNYNYLRRRQTKAESRRAFGGLFKHQIKKEELAQAVAACVLDPYVVRLGKDRLFDDTNYHRVFAQRSAYEYLAFYWLGRAVSIGSRRDPRRSYAKWVVLNHLWMLLGPAMRAGATRRALIKVSQNDRKYWRELRPLDMAVNELFAGALAFYRSARAEREGRQDESTFFKHANREQQFRRYLGGQGLRPRRRRIIRRLRKFTKSLSELDTAA